MTTLAEIQMGLREAVLPAAPIVGADVAARIDGALAGRGAPSCMAAIVDDAPGAAARLRIYAHHVVDTLTDVLAQAFPVVRQLVGPGFFAYAADAFVRAHPPATPRLFEFGDRLPGFLAEFPPCGHLGYLPDVARLEWAMQAAMHAGDAPPLAATALVTLPAEEVGRAVLGLDPSLSLIASRWPIDRMWRANQPDADPETRIALDQGRVWIEVRRLGDDVVFRTLEAGTFAFRAALLRKQPLEAAADAGLAADSAFDLPGALRALFDEEAAVSLTVQSGESDATAHMATPPRAAPPQDGA